MPTDTIRYVFISYSSEDRDRVLSIADRLEAAGIDTWIDRNQIVGGADYTQVIPGAIAKCTGILLFLSVSAFRSRNVKRELHLAWKKNKAVIPLALEPLDIPEHFEYELGPVQRILVGTRPQAEWWSDLVRALAGWGLQVAVTQSPIASRDQSAVGRASFVPTPLMPYLVNRLQQEEQLDALMTRHRDQRVRHPNIIVIYGQTNQAVHEYLDRLERSSLPRHLRRVGYRDTVYWKNLPWRRGDWQIAPDQTLRWLRTQLETVLEAPRGSWPTDIPKTISALGSTVVLCCRLRWEQWSETHLNVLTAWITDWGTLPALPPDLPLFVVIAVEYHALKPGWRDFWVPKSTSDHPVHPQLKSLSTKPMAGVSVALLDELGNVTLQDIEDWILHDLRPNNPGVVIRQAREILSEVSVSRSKGFAMQDIAERLNVLLGQATTPLGAERT